MKDNSTAQLLPCAAFTPGPWHYSPTDAETHAVVSPPHDAGDEIGPWFTAIVSSTDDATEDANARLIAAAPELYEALQSLAFEVATTAMPEASCERLLPFAMKAKAALDKVRNA